MVVNSRVSRRGWSGRGSCSYFVGDGEQASWERMGTYYYLSQQLYCAQNGLLTLLFCPNCLNSTQDVFFTRYGIYRGSSDVLSNYCRLKRSIFLECPIDRDSSTCPSLATMKYLQAVSAMYPWMTSCHTFKAYKNTAAVSKMKSHLGTQHGLQCISQNF